MSVLWGLGQHNFFEGPFGVKNEIKTTSISTGPVAAPCPIFAAVQKGQDERGS